MKSFKGYLAEVATFSPKNFPDNVGNNKEFPGAGERTTYAPVDVNNYKFKEGFITDKATRLYKEDGTTVRQLDKGAKVWFTMPATLHRAGEFGIKGRTTLAPVSLKGHDQKPDGYVVISHVVKPAGANQGRVGAGSKTQDMVALQVKDMAFKKGIEVEADFKTARPGSTIPDLVMTIDKKRTQFEIKGTNNRSAPITFFDKSVKRAGRKPEILEEIADVYIKTLKVKEGSVQSLMRKQKLPFTFVGLVDFFQSRDPKIGLAGDEGVVKSGRLPTDFAVTDTRILKQMRQTILDHFKDGGDDYFVVHNRSNDEFEIYFVGGGSAGNVLKAPELPAFKSFVLATYGGASGGATRVGLKIKL
jgi:hypothetical protein